MGKTIIKGVNEKTGVFETEHKCTAVLVTELIDALPKLCEADVQHGLEEIRKSAEQDARIRKILARSARAKKREADKSEREVIGEATEAIKRCIEKNGDMKTALVIIKMCKMIAGDRFEVKLEA